MKYFGKTKFISNWILRGILSSVFFIAAYVKFQNPYPFWEFIERVLLVPPDWAVPVQWSVIIFESGLGLLLLIYPQRIFPAWITFGLLFFFTGIIVYALYLNPNINCGCFGSIVGHNTPGITSLARNGILIVLSLGLLWINRK